mgnify:CR=1 FL=1
MVIKAIGETWIGVCILLKQFEGKITFHLIKSIIAQRWRQRVYLLMLIQIKQKFGSKDER